MPTYEYRCAAGHEFERLQRMSEPPLQTCPECGAPAERLLSAGAGLLFKGSGFYITDYRSESYRKAAAADGGGPEAGKGQGAGDAASKGSDAAASKGSDAAASKGPGGAATQGGSGGADAKP
jgi:putative FmdB family regulatory protein